jgi:hypothetical protein
MLWESTYIDLPPMSGGDIIVNGSPQSGSSGVMDPGVIAALLGGSFGVYQQTQALVLPSQTAPGDDGDEIIVDGLTRTDPASSSWERLYERLYFRFNGGYGNAEQNPDGTWSMVASLLPTDDQLIFERNEAAANTALMQALIPDAQARIALSAALTDRGLDMSRHNLAALYQEYQGLRQNGTIPQGGLSVFVNWVEGRITQL